MPRAPSRKRTRRRRGTGSVSWRPHDQYWAATTPRSHGRVSRYFDTKAEAERWLTVQLSEAGNPDRRADSTLLAYLTSWIERHGPRFSDRTKRTYLAGIRRLAPLHTKRLRDLKPSHIEQLGLHLLEAGRKNATIEATRAVFSVALAEAVDDGILPRVPISRLRLPAEQQKDSPAYTAAESRRILHACQTQPNGLLVELALCLGLRIGELVTLEWQDIDQEAGTLRVGRTAGVRTEKPGTATKTRRSRTLPLLQRNLAALERHRATQRPSVWVFPGHLKRDTHLSIDAARKTMLAILARAGVEVRAPHSLRHSTASLLESLGVSQTTRMAILGHLSPGVHAIYTHSDSAQMAEAMRRLENALDGDG